MKEIVSIINIAFYGFAFSWISQMEKNQCTCSQDWRRDYMKFFFLAAIGLQFVILAKGMKTLKNFRIPLLAASLVYLYASLTYISSLKSHSCQCSKSLERSILYWYSLIQVITLLLIAFTLS